MAAFQRVRRFFAQLRRRNVYRVAVTYAVVTFVTLQAARLIFPATTLEGAYDVLVLLAFVGFPVAVVLAWAFELTPEGMRRTAPLPEEAGGSGAGVVAAAVGLLLVAAGGSAWWMLGPAGGSETGPASDRSIAVLPFDDLSAGGEEAGIGIGFTETIIAQLALIEDLSVVSRTSVMPYRETDLALPEIATQLGVEHVLEGSVQKSGDSVRIVAQLIRADTDRHLWAETFDRPFADIFEIQSDVAGRIAGALEAELTESTRRRIEEEPTDDPAAYDLYLRGVELSDRSRSDNQAAVEILRQAIRMDSSFALAHAGLANAYMHRAQDFGYPHAWYDSAQATARRAAELDPELAQAHKEMGTAANHLGRLTEGMSALRRAVSSRPGYGEAMHNLGVGYGWQGRYGEALPWYWRSLQTSPRNGYAMASVGRTLYLLGEDAAAEAWTQRAVEIGGPRWQFLLLQFDFGRGRIEAARQRLEVLRRWNASAPRTLVSGGVLAQVDGRPEDAVPGYRRVYELRPDSRGPDISPRIRLAQALQAVGSQGEARTLLEEAVRWNRSLIEGGSEKFSPRYRLAAARLLQGRTEEAYRWLDSTYAAGFRWRPLARHDPVWRRVQGEDRFRELLARMEADLQRQREEIVAWAREEGLEWPLRPGSVEEARPASATTASR